MKQHSSKVTCTSTKRRPSPHKSSTKPSRQGFMVRAINPRVYDSYASAGVGTTENHQVVINTAYLLWKLDNQVASFRIPNKRWEFKPGTCRNCNENEG